MSSRKLEQQDKSVDVPTNNTQYHPDPQTTEDHKFFDAYLPPTLYGLIHPHADTQHISAENEEGYQLITDTEDSNRRPQYQIQGTLKPHKSLLT